LPIEVKNLGLQPKVVAADDGTYNASLVPSTEWTATGKEIHDPEFAKLMDDTAEYKGSEDERKESIFGMDLISTPTGESTRVRGDKVPFYKSQGYGVRPRTTRMLVPDLPWHKKDVGTKARAGRTLIRYRDGRALMLIENGLVLKRPKEV
jgi:hypothetical protein